MLHYIFPPRQQSVGCHNDASKFSQRYSARHGRPNNYEKSGNIFHFNALLKLKIGLICVIDCCFFFEASSDCLHKFFASGVSIRLQGRLRPCRTNGRISACYRHRTFLIPYPPAYSWCPGDVIPFSFPFLYGSSRKTNKPSSCSILFFI